MSNIIIISDSIQVHVNFGVYAQHAHINDTSFRRCDISEVSVPEDQSYVRITMANGKFFDVAHNGTSGAMTIDRINGETPSSNSELKDKINALVL